MTVDTDLLEGGSYDPAVLTKMAGAMAWPIECYHAFDDAEEATGWASAAAEASGMPYCALFVPEQGEYRCGPVDEIDVLATYSTDWTIAGVFDEDGDAVPLAWDMFSDDEAVDAGTGSPHDGTENDPADVGSAKGKQDPAKTWNYEAYLARLSKAALAERAAARTRPVITNPAREARGPAARLWRRQNHARLVAATHPLLTPPAAANERTVHHHTHDVRFHAVRKRKHTTKDAARRKVARTAKLWRLRNKSKAKRYGRLYHGPHTKVKEAALDEGSSWVDLVLNGQTGDLVRVASIEDVLRVIDICNAHGGDKPIVIEGQECVIERRRRRRPAKAGHARDDLPDTAPDQPPTGTSEPHTPGLISMADISSATESAGGDMAKVKTALEALAAERMKKTR